MANPRQRRKARSGAAKLSQSKASKKNQKKVKVQGHPQIVKDWDRTLTVRQNYEKLGLMATPNPRQSGGLEPLPVVPFVYQQRARAQAGPQASTSSLVQNDPPEPSTSAASGKIPKGWARVERDAKGNITNVILPDEDDEEESSTPWGEPFEQGNKGLEQVQVQLAPDHGLDRTQGIPFAVDLDDTIVTPQIAPRPQTDTVRVLEAAAANQRPAQVRHASDLEADWLCNLARKHAGDVEAMARDIKGNPLQRTAGQIRRSIKLAGGIESLL